MSNLKMFKVDIVIEFPIYVMAEDDHEAETIAEDNLRDAIDDNSACDGAYFYVDEIKSLDKIPSDWKNAFPYGSTPEAGVLTCKEFFNSREEKKEDERQQDLFDG